MKSFKVQTVAELSQVTSHLKTLFTGRDVLLLSGPMGVGKTELVRALVAELRGDSITSPSFAIHNNYAAGELSIDHLDLFRIEGEDDLESTGFWDLFDSKSGLIILEWAEKLDQSLLPRQWQKIKVELAFADATSREIKVSKD